MRARNIAVFTVAAALSLPVFAGPMKAGKWQIVMETKMAGMDMKMPPMTFEKCVTPEEAEKPQPPKMRNDDCKIEDYKLEGNTVTYKVKCEKAGTTGEGKITYGAEAYEGEVHMNMKGQEMTMKHSGKRIGDCDAKK
jgi:uncharacterized protein DUF3617